MERNTKKAETVEEHLISLAPKFEEIILLLVKDIVRKLEAEDEQRK